MKKTCYLCEHSVRVKWTRKYYDERYKEEELFCIVNPPCIGNGTQYEWKNITTGNSTLRKYRRYPIVSDVAPCSLYEKTDKKKKIKDYEAKLVEDKKEEKQEKQEKQDQKKVEKEYRDAKKSRLVKVFQAEKKRRAAAKERQEILKAAKEKKKKETEKVKARKEYQKQYRAKKKAEEEKKKNSYDRFDIMEV